MSRRGLARHAAKRDGNEGAIVEGLRHLRGVRLLRLSGKGVPDLAVYYPARGWVLAEVKGTHGRLTKNQDWGPEVAIWRTLDDALASLGVVRA